MQALFLERSDFSAGLEFDITEEPFHHLIRVCRMQTGDQFWIFPVQNIENQKFLAELITIESKKALIRINEKQNTNARSKLSLGIALFDRARMEWLIEKACELGVDKIYFFRAQRSQLELSPKQLLRFEKIARQACEQSHQSHLPEFKVFKSLADVCVAPIPKIYFCDEKKQAQSLALNDLNLSTPGFFLMGPEGGWTEEERILIAQKSIDSISLGESILRAETAALMLLSYFRVQVASLI